MQGCNLPQNVFFVDLDARILKKGITLHPLIVCERGILFGRKPHHFGFKYYLKNWRVWSCALFLNFKPLSDPNSPAPIWGEDFDMLSCDNRDLDEIKFENIRSIELKRHLLGDREIYLNFRKGSTLEKKTLYVANQYLAIPRETERLYNLIKERLNPGE
jgi:hypothetical protein